MACKTCNGIGNIRHENGVDFVSCPTCYCEQCEGSRFVKGEKGFSPCPACVLSKQPAQKMTKAGIPTLYHHADFDSYHTDFASASSEQKTAKMMAQTFATNLTTGSTGLLFHGDLGCGKTHLAIAVMKARLNLGFSARYYDGYSFVKLIQGTYGERERGDPREADVMETAIKCDVLVLDDLGAFKVTDDRAEIMASVMNTRYLESRVTIITTNFPFARANAFRFGSTDTPAAGSAKKTDTLGDRVGDRVMSRLEQMCVPIYVAGPDMRATVLRARM